MISFLRSKHQYKSNREKGQAFVTIAIMFIALLAFVGLVIDVGRVFIFRGGLRNAVDAASLAAAAQYREMRSFADIEATAIEVMELNGISPSTVSVETCTTNPGDVELCTTPPRKLIRVSGTVVVPMAFLQLVGVDDVTIALNAIGEAASMDVVLVIDISASMTSDGATLNDRDPSQCNPTNSCQPFEDVKAAATIFATRILDKPASEEQDRLAIIIFSNGWEAQTSTNRDEPGYYKGTTVITTAPGNPSQPAWISDKATALTIIDKLQVHQPVDCDPLPPFGPCLIHNGTNYIGPYCVEDAEGPASCPTTNIGGGLLEAGNMFAVDSHPASLWVVVILTDGAANASNPSAGHTYGFCPDATKSSYPYCRDDFSSTYHSGGSNYDADDYARDMADFVGCYPTNPASECSTNGQGALIFAIGLGNKVLSTYAPGDVAHGVSLLRYIANVGYDGNPDPAVDPCAGLYGNLSDWQEWCGNYYFSPTGNQLDKVFEDIASRIFTRLSH